MWDQFDPITGKPVGHQARYCRKAATWLQSGKFSGLPINVILLVVMIHVNAVQHRNKAHAVIDQLAGVVAGCSPLKIRSRATATLNESEHTAVRALNALLGQ